jgi:hypothetical protein
MLFSIFSIFTQLPSEFIALLLFERMLLPLLFAGRKQKHIHHISGNSLNGEGIKYKYLMAVRAIFS